MSEAEAIETLKAMTDEELLLVDHSVVKWVCQGKKCCRGTKIRDYGIAPLFFHPRKSIRWFDINKYYWMCEKHFKMYKRLVKNFPKEAVERKIFDPTKPKLLQKEKPAD